MNDIATDLRQTIASAEVWLLERSDSQAGQHPAPGKWSPKEILGHLIDSAANNHVRFIKGQLKDDLMFEGYEQDEWVRLQDYQHARWEDLVALWKAYNLHLARVIERIPDEVAYREIRLHNLDRLAWKTVSAESPTTLAYFIQDYVDHLKHHLRQIQAV